LFPGDKGKLRITDLLKGQFGMQFQPYIAGPLVSSKNRHSAASSNLLILIMAFASFWLMRFSHMGSWAYDTLSMPQPKK
jgi:hypothetical protein